MPKDLIKCKNVWKIYGEGTHAEVNALHDIDLDIFSGEFASIIGSSGSGKSTLMNCIGCLDKPTKGKIYFEGEDISVMDDNQLAAIRRKKIGFIFQFFNLVPSLTALENVELPMVFNGVEEGVRRKRAEQLLEEVGLKGRMKHRQSELSGGERQRVAVARALTNDPSLILADEPTGNLDSKSGEEVLNILKDLNKEGKTVVIITHDSAIARATQKTIRIKDGTIIK